ncbi:hypothetical protein HAX54_044013, partial [Datura stramonium]|nr:hypothetical protein [Datura stramonium]
SMKFPRAFACKLVLDELANMEEGDPGGVFAITWEHESLNDVVRASGEVVTHLKGLGIILTV